MRVVTVQAGGFKRAMLKLNSHGSRLHRDDVLVRTNFSGQVFRQFRGNNILPAGAQPHSLLDSMRSRPSDRLFRVTPPGPSRLIELFVVSATLQAYHISGLNTTLIIVVTYHFAPLFCLPIFPTFAV